MDGMNMRDWTQQKRSIEEYQKLFLNMDSTMHYIHNRGWGITSFNPTDIKIINDQDNQLILFDKIDQIEPEYQNAVVQHNIFNLSLLAIRTYANWEGPMNIEVLKENFNDISLYLPKDDVSYYRWVITNNSIVYYSEYVKQNMKNQIAKDKELFGVDDSENTKDNSRLLTKHNAAGKLYSQLNDDNLDTAAFISLYIFPAIIIFLSIMIPLIAWISVLIKK